MHFFYCIIRVKYLKNGWSVPKEGFDIVNEKKKIFVEMKNKHNTMNSSSSQNAPADLFGQSAGVIRTVLK